MHPVGKTLCRVNYRDGIPYLEFKRVIRSTRSSFYMDGYEKEACRGGWHEDWKKAVQAERDYLFSLHCPIWKPKLPSADWTMDDTLDCLIKIRRLVRRIKSHRKRNTLPQ